MILLTIALFFDAIVNIGRIIEVERGLKIQEKWLNNRDAEIAQVIRARKAAEQRPGWTELPSRTMKRTWRRIFGS